MARKKQNVVEMAQISISLPCGLLGVIDKMAAQDNRTRSNFIVNVLRKAAREWAQESAQEGGKDGR